MFAVFIFQSPLSNCYEIISPHQISEYIRKRYKQQGQLVSIQLLTQMAKKVSKKNAPAKLKRKSSMQKCIVDAQDFLKSTKEKKIVKTRTMARTIEEGKKMLAPKKKAPAVRKIAPAPKRIKRYASPCDHAAGSCHPPLSGASSFGPIPSPAVPASVGSTMIRARSIDKSLKPSKATIFKTGSKDNLPLPAFGFIDICFCVDATGSMGSELAQVQSTIVSIIEKIQNKVRTEGITLRFAVVAYRDHCDSNLLDRHDFTDAHDTIEFVKKLSANGGGDEPEAAHDGLLQACKKLNWVELPGTPMLRYIFHILDAQPHGKEFGNLHEKEGACTCGKTTEDVIREINIRQIHYRMVKVRNNPRVDMAEAVFRGRMGNFDSVDIAGAHEMNIRVSDMIIHEIMPQA